MNTEQPIATELSYAVLLKIRAELEQPSGKVTAPVEKSSTPATAASRVGRSGIQLSNMWQGR